MGETVELRYGLENYRKNWRLCSAGSNFLADSGFSEPNVAEIASMSINELMELAFRCSAQRGHGHVRARWAQPDAILLTLEVHVESEKISDLRQQIRAFEANACDYFESTVGVEQPPLLFGLSYLAHDFAASVGFTLRDAQLGVELTLESKRWHTA